MPETTPYWPSKSICGKKGAKATWSWPFARSIAARADRIRGLFCKAKAIASGSAKIVGAGVRLGIGGGFEGYVARAPGLTTVSAGLTFRSCGIRTRAATPAGLTSKDGSRRRCGGAEDRKPTARAAEMRQSPIATASQSRAPRTVAMRSAPSGVLLSGRRRVAGTRPRWAPRHRRFRRPDTSCIIGIIATRL